MGIYNYFLSIPAMSGYDINYALAELKEQHPWLRKYHSKTLQMVVAKQVAAARKAAKGMCVRWKKLSYRKYGDFNAFYIPYNQSGFKIKDGELYLSKTGSGIRIVLHRKPINVKQLTISRTKTGKWYAVAACETLSKSSSTIIRYVKPAAVVVGIAKFCHDSDGHVVEKITTAVSYHDVSAVYLTERLRRFY